MIPAAASNQTAEPTHRMIRYDKYFGGEGGESMPSRFGEGAISLPWKNRHRNFSMQLFAIYCIPPPLCRHTLCKNESLCVQKKGLDWVGGGGGLNAAASMHSSV